MKKILMTLALLFALAQGAWAEDVKYLYYDVKTFDSQVIFSKYTGIANNPTVLTSELISGNTEDRLYDGWYVLDSSFTYDERIVIYGDVKLILKDGCTLTVKKGIRINTDATLTIYAQSENEETMGKIVAHGNTKDQAVIGGNKNYLAGRIFIHGGYIDAKATNKKGAAIGGGYDEDSGMKEITIYGGKVIAKGYDNGAGIGAAEHNNYVGNINIYGGTVEATGGDYAAGIGGAEDRGGWNTTIYGGKVTAVGGYRGAGIGGGEEGGAGVINIKGGDVTARSTEDGAAIGTGDVTYHDTGGTITISGGLVHAICEKLGGSGIGGGTNVSFNGTIIIEGGEVYATGGNSRPGIGGGLAGTIIIRGDAKVEATSLLYGAGIGASGVVAKGTVTISGNADVTAIGGAKGGPGIGCTLDNNGFTVNILGGTVKAYGSNRPVPFYHTTFTSAAIGGGCEKENGCNVSIANGAKVYLYTAEGKERFAIGRSNKKCKTGALDLGSNLMVKRIDGSSSEFISTDNRISVCQLEESKELQILPCDHSACTYELVGDSDGQHIVHCQYCEYVTEAENHIFNEYGTCTVCGYQKNCFTVSVHRGIQEGISGYALYVKTRVPEGNGYILPNQFGLPGYMVFEGWLQDPAKAPSNWEMAEGEREMLLAPGTEVFPTANTNFYARYSYQYGTEWTWTASTKTASASLKIINLENNRVVKTIDSDDDDMQITARSIEPTNEEPGSVFYAAEVNYTDEQGRNFIFTDEHTVPWYFSVSLGEDDNTTTIAENDGVVADATLTHRYLYKNGKWNTLCLPFDVELEGSPLEGATVKEFDDGAYNAETGMLTLTFSDATSIKAGQAYLVKWDSGTNLSPSDLVFTGVTLRNTLHTDEITINDEGTASITFMGTYKKLTFSTDDPTILFFGVGDRLYYPQSGANINAQRAYFQLSGFPADAAAHIRAFSLDFGDDGNTTGIIEVEAPFTPHALPEEGWYTIDGRRLFAQPTARGIYINNGKKIVIK